MNTVHVFSSFLIRCFKKLVADDSYFPEVEELDHLTREIKAIKADIAGLIDENKKLRAMVITIVFSTLCGVKF